MLIIICADIGKARRSTIFWEYKTMFRWKALSHFEVNKRIIPLTYSSTFLSNMILCIECPNESLQCVQQHCAYVSSRNLSPLKNRRPNKTESVSNSLKYIDSNFYYFFLCILIVFVDISPKAYRPWSQPWHNAFVFWINHFSFIHFPSALRSKEISNSNFEYLLKMGKLLNSLQKFFRIFFALDWCAYKLQFEDATFPYYVHIFFIRIKKISLKKIP